MYKRESDRYEDDPWKFHRLGPPLIVFTKFNPYLEFVSEHDEVPGVLAVEVEEENEWSRSRSPKG